MVTLTCQDITKIYDNTIVLDNLSFEIRENETLGLLGPNGCGKTTLIKIINGLIQPTAGLIKYKNKKLETEDRKSISYLPERTYLDLQLRPIEALKMFQDFYDDFDIEKAKHLLTLFEIPLYKKMSRLSKGQKGKVQLSLIFGRSADLYILDEPLDGMDPASRDYIMKIIDKYRKPNSTILISTHLISDIEEHLTSFMMLKAGRIVKKGDTKLIKKETGKTLDQIFREVYKHDEKDL